MSSMSSIKQSAQIITTESGEQVVQIPIDVWNELLTRIETSPPQHEQIKALLQQWETEPDETPDTWWDEFDTFLREN